MTDTQQIVHTTPIERAAFSPYGDLIAVTDGLQFQYANMRTAKRFNHVSPVKNLRKARAELNLCLFRCSPLADLPLELKLLERHLHSTQVFLPMSNQSRFLVIVCLGREEPDLSTLRAFEATSGQGISYKPGVWHYPMTALDREVDFACLIWEDGSKEDCHIFNLERPIQIG